jgi:ABC-type proline/glycine betaine transport system permease subunit
MRHILTLAIRAALVAAVVGVVRALLLDRTPQRALHGTQPVVGSLDTWPQVPRRPADEPGLTA